VIKYYMTITATGYSDLTLPMSSFQARDTWSSTFSVAGIQWSSSIIFLSVVIPGVTYESTINSMRAASGQFYVEMAYFYGGVESFREEIVRANIEDVYSYHGARNKTIRIDGHRGVAFPSATTHALEGVSYQSKLDGSINAWRTAVPNLNMKAGHSATYDSETISTIKQITTIVSPTYQYQEISV